MTHSPEHMRQKTEARMKAEYDHMNANVNGMCVKQMSNEKPNPSHSVVPDMSHNRDGLGITRG